MGNTLPKCERLHSKSDIDALLSKGRFSTAGEMKYCVRKGTGESVNRIMISVSKKFFRRAVKRNLLKRRIREAYRTRKSLLEGGGTDILFVYSTKEVLPYERIAAIVENILVSVRES